MKPYLPLVLFSGALLGLVACSSPASTIRPDNSVPILRTDGAATFVHAGEQSERILLDSSLIVPGDEIRTAGDQAVTLRLTDGSTLHLEPGSRLSLFALRSSDQRPLFRLLGGAISGKLYGPSASVQAYKETPMNFRIIPTDLTVQPHTGPGSFRVWLDGSTLKAIIVDGEFDVQAGDQQATLPAGWQASVEPGKDLQIVSLITPTSTSPFATGAPTATSIPIITLTPTSTPTDTPTGMPTETPTETPLATATETSTAIPSATLTPTATFLRRTVIPLLITPTAPRAVNTPLPPPTDKPAPRPKKTNPPPQPTNPPPRPTIPPPKPTNPPPQPTEPRPTPRPTVGA